MMRKGMQGVALWMHLLVISAQSGGAHPTLATDGLPCYVVVGGPDAGVCRGQTPLMCTRQCRTLDLGRYVESVHIRNIYVSNFLRQRQIRRAVVGGVSGLNMQFGPGNKLMQRAQEIRELQKQKAENLQKEVVADDKPQNIRDDKINVENATNQFQQHPTDVPSHTSGTVSREDRLIFEELQELRNLMSWLTDEERDVFSGNVLTNFREDLSRIEKRMEEKHRAFPPSNFLEVQKLPAEELDDKTKDVLRMAEKLMEDSGGEIDQLAFGRLWKSKHPHIMIKDIATERFGLPGSLGRLLDLSHRIQILDHFSDGRRWPGVKVYSLASVYDLESREFKNDPSDAADLTNKDTTITASVPKMNVLPQDAGVDAGAQSESLPEQISKWGLDGEHTVPEMLDDMPETETLGKVYADMIEETQRLNKVVDTVENILRQVKVEV